MCTRAVDGDYIISSDDWVPDLMESFVVMQLFSALKENNTLTSLDLSENLMTDDSIQFLLGVLAAGSAPNLIYVDVRGNPISDKSQEILGRLHNLRKHLKVR